MAEPASKRLCAPGVPASLVDFVGRALAKSLIAAGLTVAPSVTPAAAVQQLLAALAPDTSARAFQQDGLLLAALLAGDTAAAGALSSGTLSVASALELARARRGRAARSRAVIRDHHTRLREQVAMPTLEAQHASWAAAVSDGKALRAYAEAASETGQRRFVRCAQAWCAAQIRSFFYDGGAARLAVKAWRRAYFAQQGALPSPEAGAAAMADAAAQLAASIAAEPDGRLKLLDVGSCWDPWRPLEDQFSITAFDLEPACATVFRCDALALQLGKPGSTAVVEPPAAAADGAGRLLSLAKASYHIVVLSLVLSYLPTPGQRSTVCGKARALLRDDAALLLIVTPHSTAGSRPSGGGPGAILREWEAALEGMGFQRVAIEKLPTVFGLACRTVPRSGTAALLPMRIAYDDRPPHSVEEAVQMG